MLLVLKSSSEKMCLEQSPVEEPVLRENIGG